MMMSPKSFAVIVVILAIIGLVIGLFAHWLGAPWWAPLAGAGTPVVLAAVLLGYLYFSGDR